MRTLCDVCESAAAILFCAADEAALCSSCDDKVHTCNKLASRHVRVGLAEPSAVPCCDICENAPAFFYCEKDGSSLCLQCDMMVHVGGKRTHGRYLLLRQRVEFPVDKSLRLGEPGSQQGDLGEAKRESIEPSNFKGNKNQQNHRASSIPMLGNHRASSIPMLGNNSTHDGKMENKLIDLNARPQQMHGQAPNNQEQVDTLIGNHHEDASLVPDGYLKSEPEK